MTRYGTRVDRATDGVSAAERAVARAADQLERARQELATAQDIEGNPCRAFTTYNGCRNPAKGFIIVDHRDNRPFEETRVCATHVFKELTRQQAANPLAEVYATLRQIEGDHE